MIDGFRTVRSAMLLPLVLIALHAFGQAPETTPSNSGQPSVQLLRFDEDWTPLCSNGAKPTGIEKLKYIPLGETACGRRYLSLGGEYRGSFEHLQNDLWGAAQYPTNTFGLERFQFHADVHALNWLRVFIQLESGLTHDRLGGARPIDEKRLDFLNAFIDLRPFQSTAAPVVRIGRQEFNFGSGRLVAVREGPNVRQGFYGFRIDQSITRWKISGFAARPARDNPGYFDNVPDSTTEFWGVFAEQTDKGRSTRNFDLYYFGLDRKSWTFNRGTGPELRQTLGSRLAYQPETVHARAVVEPDADIEGVFQFGRFANTDIRAWTIAAATGLTFPQMKFSPRIGIRSDVASGDSGRGSFGTFNPLYPIGNYFGVFSDAGFGPLNFVDFHPDVQFTFVKHLTLDTEWMLWWRESTHDGLYDIPGDLLFPTGNSRSRYVGHRPGTELHWQITEHAYLQADYGIFFAGKVLGEVGHPHNLEYSSVWLGYRF